MTRRVRSLLVIVAVMGCVSWTSLLATASAAPVVGDCELSPVPQMPDRGLSGWIDSGPAHYDPAAKTIYATVEYPPPWGTFDTGCVPDVGAALDTTIGNWIKGAATTLVAVTNSLHRLVSPPTFMAALNPLLVQGSDALRRALFTPYIGVSLLLIGCGIVWAARRKNLPHAVEAVTWALIVLTVAAALWQFPVRAGQAFDDTATSVIGDVNQQVLGTPGGHQDPSTARAELLTQSVLYDEWLAGELGSSGSVTAHKYGLRLLRDQTFSYQDLAKAQGAQKTLALMTLAKEHDFFVTAKKIKAEDGAAYQNLKGQGSSRIGAGARSLFAAVMVTPFMIAADVLVVIALFIVRFVVIFFPGIAVIGVFSFARPMVINVWQRAAAGVVNAVVFAAGAAVNALAVRVILSPAVKLPAWAQLLVCGVVVFLLWKAFKPFRKLNAMVSPGQAGKAMSGDPADVAKAVRKAARREELRDTLTERFTHKRRKSSSTTAGDPVDDEPVPVVVRSEAFTRADPVRYEEAAPVRDESAPDVRHRAPEPDPIPVPTVPPPPDPPAREPDPILDQPHTVYRVPEINPPKTVYDAGEPLPAAPFRADTVTGGDGVEVWRIWDPSTKTYLVEARDEGATDGH